jgi:hemerythrin
LILPALFLQPKFTPFIMAALTWNEALALQQPRMDNTHREFVDLLCEVEQALDGDLGALQGRFGRFVQHTVEHFAQEDRWMQQIGFAPANCHSFQHQHVLQVLQEVNQRLLDQADVATVRALVPELAQWFPAHAQSMDAALAQTMEERGFDPDTGLVALPLPAEPITGCGSTSCS